MTYYQVVRNMSNAFDLRRRRVRMAEEEGISATARQYRTSRKSVQKWVSRHSEGGLEALKNGSRVPSAFPTGCSPELERKIIRVRTRDRAWGPKRLKMCFDLPCSEGAIYRVLRQNGLIRKRETRWKKRWDLTKLTAALKPFGKILVEGKHVTDVETFAHSQAFFDKAATYQLFCNTERTNRNKDNQTPLPPIQVLAGRIDADGAVQLRPIALGALI